MHFAFIKNQLNTILNKKRLNMLRNNPFHYSIATRIRNSYIIKYLSPTPKDKILDIGCGVGYFSQLLSNFGSELHGLDISEESVSICKSNISENFTVGNAESLQYSDNQFDKILCSEVLEHLKNDLKAVTEMWRILKPNGTVLITVPSTEGIFGSKIKNIMHDHDDGPEKHEREGYTNIQIVKLLENSGFIVEKVNYTMVFFTEIIMGITKKAYGKKTKEDHLDSQADVLKVSTSKLFKIYKIIFPLLLLIAKIDDILFSKILKGHMIVIKAKKD